MIQRNTQTTITTFAQSGGFVGADRIVEQMSDYYASNGSWQGVNEFIANLMSDQTSAGHSGQGGGQSSGHSGGQGTGMGASNRFGLGSGYGMGNIESFTLTDSEGTVIYTQNTEVPAQFSKVALENAIPVTVDDKIAGYLIPGNTLVDLSDVISNNLNQAIRDSIFPTILISISVALVLALLFTQVFVQPIRKLTMAVQKLGEGDLTQRVKVGGSNEIRQMANTFNQMAESLQRATKARKAMTADIAHELRTPLSVQLANLEALQDGIYPLIIENLSPIMQQNKLLTQLVEDLRTLALADAESLSLDLQPVELNKLVHQVYENFKPQFAQNGLHLEFKPGTASQPISLNLDHQRITQILSNLLQNAQRHTPVGGSVQIAIAANNDSVTVVVKDNGEGIPPEALPQIFDRFYRADQSRARDKGGTGLGLTIARRLAEAHHGTLKADNNPEGGAIFTLTLPV